jgi:hypothetical protein
LEQLIEIWEVSSGSGAKIVCLLSDKSESAVCLVGKWKSIVHIGPASFVRLFTEIATGLSASILDNFSWFWAIFNHIISEFTIGLTTEMTHWQTLNAWQHPFACVLFIVWISNGWHCLLSLFHLTSRKKNVINVFKRPLVSWWISVVRGQLWAAFSR